MGSIRAVYIYTLAKPDIAPEHRPGPKRKRSYSNHPFSGVNCYFREGIYIFSMHTCSWDDDWKRHSIPIGSMGLVHTTFTSRSK